MTDVPATPAPAPALTVAEIVATIRNAINTLPEPTRTDTIYALDYLEPAIEGELNSVIKSYASKIPAVGSLIGGAVVNAIDGLIREGFVQVVPPEAPAVFDAGDPTPPGASQS